MGVLRSIVQTLVPPVLDRGHHVCLCRVVAGQLVGDHHTRGPHLPLHYHVPSEAGLLYVKFRANVVTQFTLLSFMEKDNG